MVFSHTLVNSQVHWFYEFFLIACCLGSYRRSFIEISVLNKDKRIFHYYLNYSVAGFYDKASIGLRLKD